MKFHSGLGILVAPVAALGFLSPIVLESWITLYHRATLPDWFVMPLAAILPAFNLFCLDSILKRVSPTKRGVDRITGQEIDTVQTHTFMFLSVKRWAYVWIGFATFLGVTTLVYD